MRTIGLLGGMSWESTSHYYRLINEGVKRRLGGLHSAKILLQSFDFHDIEVLQRDGNWTQLGEILAEAALRLEKSGADFLLVCANTMHKVVPRIEHTTSIPTLHITDATACAVKEREWSRVGLLGTRFVMEQDFYPARLTDRHGLQVVVPGPEEREIIDRVIYTELCRGIVSDESREHLLRIIHRLYDQGAEAVIEGCTEISMLVRQKDTYVPLLDTTQIHAEAAVDWALDTQWDGVGEVVEIRKR